MKEVHNKLIEAKLAEIQKEVSTHKNKMVSLREDLINMARFFESYTEMYSYIKAHTPDLETFCRDMNDARKVWENRNKKEGDTCG